MRRSGCALGRGLWGHRWPSIPSPSVAPQESISDFYWYYSGKDVIEEQGKRNFSKAMSVAKQVFNSLTEYIQVGPAAGTGRGGRTHAPPGAHAALCPPGPLHREPAEPGAQPPLGRRGGIPARVCPHDDEASSGSGPSVLHPTASGHPPAGPFPRPAPPLTLSPKCSGHVPDRFPPFPWPNPSSFWIGSLCLTPPPPLPPPIGWFPIHTSIGLTFGPAPYGLEHLYDWLVSFSL